MRKFVRFAGVALLALTIGVFGCGDDDDPVAPTVTVTVPPDDADDADAAAARGHDDSCFGRTIAVGSTMSSSPSTPRVGLRTRGG